MKVTELERLKEIKKRFQAMNELESFKKLAPTELFFDDIEYLIKQAERYQELKDFFNDVVASRNELSSRNKRYKQALEEILKQHENEEEIDDYDFMWNVQQIASKALKGDSNG